MRPIRYPACLAALLLSPNFAHAAPLPFEELPTGADSQQVTVAGISSGAMMAVQMHVALSAKIRAIAAFAGGVYACGRGDFATLRRCAHPQQEADIPLPQLLAETRARAQRGAIDPVAGLARSRVYLFTGANDGLIVPAVGRQLQAFYRQLMPEAAPEAIVLNEDPLANHAWISPDATQGCAEYGGQWINNCGDDPQADYLKLFYGPLQKRAVAPLSGQLIRFSQAPFADGQPATRGLADEGFAYIPRACSASGNGCRVHLALHGCMMSSQDLGDSFVRLSGINPWADSNRIIVVYPQARPSESNPRGCWDVWGIHDAAYDTKTGGQMRFFAALIERLTAR